MVILVLQEPVPMSCFLNTELQQAIKKVNDSILIVLQEDFSSLEEVLS